METSQQRILISVSQRASSNGVYFYNGIFRKLGMSAVYLGCQTRTLHGFRDSLNFIGVHAASIAAPFKCAVPPLLDDLTDAAKLTMSVNAVRRDGDRLTGDNTDIAGIRTVLASNTANMGRQPSVLIYGSGGVVPSVVSAIRLVHADAQIYLSSRNHEVGKALCGNMRVIWCENPSQRSFDLWINATPAGIDDPVGILRLCLNAATVFDLVAIQAAYPFEESVRARGQGFLRGFDLYRAQFLEQFRFYFGCELDPSLFDELARARLLSW